ncbi:hypothetical protein PIB30_042267 [Stylosanthes scabra]|uniref:Uncharacterized protein n=1 Tax=Stylosanthes scabra TaxID=79078 RepID=A0ABU6TET0_9FABA|nr:hypothetical protein [Stylosanthes scabra]
MELKKNKISNYKAYVKKERVSYVDTIDSSEEFDHENFEVDLAELKKQKLKDRDISLCPRCNDVFDAEVAALFEKERMKMELAHKEEQVRQRHGSCRNESSNLMADPPIQMQWVGESSRTRFPRYNEYPACRNFRGQGRGRGRGHGRFHGQFGQLRGRRRFYSHNDMNRNTKSEASPS